MSEVKRWYTRDPNSILATAQLQVVLAADYDAIVTQRDNWRHAAMSKQAQIDRLMLEFCPGEMSQEQRDEWARNQVRSPQPVGTPQEGV